MTTKGEHKVRPYEQRVSYRIAVFSLGLVIGGYWLRVLRMARKARVKTGRAANFLPAEPVGRVLRVAWIPIVIVWIGQPFVASLLVLHHRLIAPLMHNPWIAWIAVVVAAGCFWLSRICWKTMGKSWRMGIDPAERTSLVLAGPYQYVRHPIYALSQLMMLASVVAVPSPLMIGAGLAHVLLLQWEARREEKHLLNTHGNDYVQYCALVGRFFPGRSALQALAQPRAE